MLGEEEEEKGVDKSRKRVRNMEATLMVVRGLPCPFRDLGSSS